MKKHFAMGFAICLLAMGKASTVHAKQVHVVGEGDTLWGISRSYGCELDALREENGLKGDTLSVGSRLHIPDGEPANAVRVAVATEPSSTEPSSTEPSSTSHRHRKEAESARKNAELITHKIVSGDTLAAIAERYDTSVDDLVSRNGLGGTEIYAGHDLQVLPGANSAVKRWVLGQSVGATNRGRLKNPSRLKAGPGYYIRRPERSYGAEHTIRHVKRAVDEVRSTHRKTHRLAVGDISAKQGGKISMHASHQSGRDIDLGFYFKKKPQGYPQSFVDATPTNLDFDATWTLLMSFASTQAKPGGVEQIFISYETQKLLYKEARKRKIGKGQLEKILQYPHGRSSRKALVRHEPGHNEHMHVRFSCPPKDEVCK